MNVTLNSERRLYIIPSGHGYSCMGFDNARNHADQIARLMEQPSLALSAEDYGTLAGYAKYQTALQAWGQSKLSQLTYFDPGTDPKVARVLETCRRDRRMLRLMQGDTATGQCWLSECDVVGHIGRSSGMLKVPLLIEPGANGGAAILTNCLLRLIDWKTGRDLYRHPAFRTPDLSIHRQADNEDLPWQVLHDGQVAACFRDIGKAGAYVAFMCGEMVEPRAFE